MKILKILKGENKKMEEKTIKPARIIVLVGPSGSGKTAIADGIVKTFPDIFRKVVTTTTRQPREEEVNGVHYHFVDKLSESDCVESTVYSGNAYGTTISELEKGTEIPILVMDINGVYNLKKAYPESKVVSIFIDRDINEMTTAILSRGCSDTEKIERIKKLKDDYLSAEKTQFVLKNSGTTEEAVDSILKHLLS